jgi:hypothetical protein
VNIIKTYLSKSGRLVRRGLNKKELMTQKDVEGRSPCEKCYKLDLYTWPLKGRGSFRKHYKRCEYCGRAILKDES